MTERILAERDGAGLLPDDVVPGRVFADPVGPTARRLLAEDPRLAESLVDTLSIVPPEPETPESVAGGDAPLQGDPGRVSSRVECRILPDTRPAGCEAEIRKLLGIHDVKFEVEEEIPGSASPVESPLWDVMAKAVRSRLPRSAILPGIASGPTGLGPFRNRDAVAYGFTPLPLRDGLPDLHEESRVPPLEALRAAITIYYDIVAEFCTS
jgi:acetylornithine deacetylase/succinyl-diaminopimelate desuccinylase-like protein